MKNLKLTLKTGPFMVMYTGEKTLEVRKPSDWIDSRLLGKKYPYVEFYLGGYFSKKLPYFISEFKGAGIFMSENILCHTYSNGFKLIINPNDRIIELGKIVEHNNIIGITPIFMLKEPIQLTLF